MSNEDLLLRALLGAIRSARRSRSIVLLGMNPQGDRREYGWIVPKTARGDGACPVSAFVEKPDVETARDLQHRGAVVNSLIAAAHARTLLRAFDLTAPQLVAEMLGPHKLDTARIEAV